MTVPVEYYLETLLTEWGRWARNHTPRGHCRSIEHRFKTSEVWEREPCMPAPDALLVLRVERQMLHLPRRLKGCLVIEYCRHPFVRTCKQYGIFQPNYHVMLNKAKTIMRNRLQHYEGFAIVQSQLG